MKRAALLAGCAALLAGWSAIAAGSGVTAHMWAHMAVVAIAAPLIAYAAAATRWDPAARWPAIVTPLAMSVVEIFVVWGWHFPAARAFAASSVTGLVLEQVMFLAGGLLLWSACFGARHAATAARRATGVIALLLTSMHMTLLGALITLAPRPLYDVADAMCFGVRLDPMADQQAGGVIMLFVGAGSYLIGGLALLGATLRLGSSKGAPS